MRNPMKKKRMHRVGLKEEMLRGVPLKAASSTMRVKRTRKRRKKKRKRSFRRSVESMYSLRSISLNANLRSYAHLGK